MEILLGCIIAALWVAVVEATRCLFIFVIANYLVCPAFGLSPISWLQALALSIVVGIIFGYIKGVSDAK